MKKVSIGLLLILAKFVKVLLPLAAKAFGLIAQLFKGAGVAKLGLGAASFGVDSVLFGWRFAVMILLLIGIHESGHVWAMRRMGMQTRGFYFIPLFGGMAVPKDAFPSAWAEGYVALMGPIWGLFVTAATYIVFLATGQPVYEVATCWMAFVNLLNLLPIFPLDGGRVARSLAESAKGWASVAIVIAVSVIGILFTVSQGYVLFAFFGGLGFFEALWERRMRIKVAAETDAKKPWVRQSLTTVARVLGCQPQATWGDIERAFGRLRVQTAEDERMFSRLRQCRAEYGAWEKDWQALLRRWDSAFELRGYVVHFPELIAEYGANAVCELRNGLERPASWRKIKSATAEGRIFLPDAEYERAQALANQLLAILEQARSLLVVADERVSRLCVETGVPDDRVLIAKGGWHPNEFWNRDAMALRAVFVLGATPIDRRYGKDFRISGFEIDFVSGDRNGERRTFEAEENWLTATHDLILFGLMDPGTLDPVRKHWARCCDDHFVMSPVRSFAIAATYILLAATLFLFMEGTGGQAAAAHAVKFFREM